MPTAHHPSLIETLSSPQVVPTLSLYVAGEWAEAADGRTFESYEPATGRYLGEGRRGREGGRRSGCARRARSG